MTILEKEISVCLNSNNIEYYQSLNYPINRVKNRWGKLVVPRGIKLLVKIEDLMKGCNIKLTKICDECGKHVENQQYIQILKYRNNSDGKDRCLACARFSGVETRMNNVKFENSLEYHAKENNKKYLLDEFSDKNIKKASEVSYGSHKEYFWNCIKCKSEYLMEVSDRTSGSNCPYCAGMRVNNTNCLWTTHPEVAKLLKNPERGYEVTSGSNQKELFQCKECNFEKRIDICNAVYQGFSCFCSDGISYPEKFMIHLLNQIGTIYLTQHRFKWSKNKKYDFYIPSLNTIIETHGSQHYRQPSGNWGSLNEIQENDKLKENLAKDNGINYYICIDCSQSNLEYIKNSILKSELAVIYDLKDMQWENIHENSLNSLVKVVCDMWDSGIKNAKTIGKFMKLSSPTVVKYLKKGKLIGWCDYDPNEVKRQTGKLSGKKNEIRIVQLNMNKEYIKSWESATKAGNALGILQGNITAVCRGRYKYSGGFKWMYEKDYENMI